MYVLTDEGRKYLKNGLPERNLAELLSKGPVDLTAARKKVENFDIAVQWGKKKGFVEIKNGVLFLTKKPSFQEEEALSLVNGGKKIDSKLADILAKRNLIEVQRISMRKRAEKLAGGEVTNLTEELIKTGVWKNVRLKPYNVEAKGRKLYLGKRQPYRKFLGDIRRKLVELGFTEMTGPTIETEFWNFDALYQPQNHPSRDWAQTYSLKYPKRGWLPDKKFIKHVKASHENGWKTGSTGWRYAWSKEKASQLMPRAHATALSARTLADGPSVPGKYFAISRCYRPDVIDATHGVEFNQMEGIVVAEKLNFRHLLGLLKMFAVEFADAEEVKFLPDYYPFTEPSVQMSAKHPELGWIEFGGAGIFREELTRPLGVDVPVIAWGIGIDRLAMFKLGINDIRQLFSQDLKWLRDARVV